MRILALNVGVALLLLLAAATASAFAVNMTARGALTSLATSDTVTVDVFLDADGGITIFSVAVMSDPAVLKYDAAASAALPLHPQSPLYGGSTGAQPSYVLYTPAMGKGQPMTYLTSLQTPAFLEFPVTGTGQVNVNFIENALGTTTATGTGIYLASLVFQVLAEFATSELSLAFTSANVLQAGAVVTPDSAIGLSAPITLAGADSAVPEPTTAMLIGLGILGLLFAGRRRA